MVVCVFKKCKNRPQKYKKEDGITYHKFPVDEIRKLSWIKSVREERNDPYWVPSRLSVVCSLHFDEEDFCYTKTGLRRIQRNANPRFQILDKTETASSVTPIQNTKIDQNASASSITAPESPLNVNKENVDENVDNPEIESTLQSPHVAFLMKKINEMQLLQQKHLSIIKKLKSKCKRLKAKNMKLQNIATRNLKIMIL